MVNRLKTCGGAMDLPMPTGEAKLEKVAGSMRLVGRLSFEQLVTFWISTADQVMRGELPRPARVVLVVAGQEQVTPIPEDYGPRASARLLLELTDVKVEGPVETVGFDLACGCGLRVGVVRP